MFWLVVVFLAVFVVISGVIKAEDGIRHMSNTLLFGTQTGRVILSLASLGFVGYLILTAQ